MFQAQRECFVLRTTHSKVGFITIRRGIVSRLRTCSRMAWGAKCQFEILDGVVVIRRDLIRFIARERIIASDNKEIFLNRPMVQGFWSENQ